MQILGGYLFSLDAIASWARTQGIPLPTGDGYLSKASYSDVISEWIVKKNKEIPVISTVYPRLRYQTTEEADANFRVFFVIMAQDQPRATRRRYNVIKFDDTHQGIQKNVEWLQSVGLPLKTTTVGEANKWAEEGAWYSVPNNDLLRFPTERTGPQTQQKLDLWDAFTGIDVKKD
ncbi:uncharacterized protein STEHIDRAFT_108169 [Stereum hirsutum FP-91666 SS1]|uniref:uncharacterized protein n=1 Tax=Stereum hirsutum (strain FP-91666) TaxID=721885 RepID=UPI000440D353|nr:uncharacterized protein STEHIDRAFT_108169 [Stereum hirsutum FP-91666 SS1]EIM91671.1 hypothetical protein STEHIDRAFT_108169 [Stereum hirsutum FP-91666 SS1]